MLLVITGNIDLESNSTVTG